MSRWKHSESIVVSREPEELYALVSDVTRMGEWSPVNTGGWWDDDSRGVGAWFTGRNEVPGRTWETRSQVVADEPGREFAFIVGGDRVRWGYTFEPTEGGTRMTESWEILPAGEVFFRDKFGEQFEEEVEQRAETARSGIHDTIAAIKKAAEAQ
ncbi:polyketide cyclase/dehydrase/lipid transport protein [Homoserinimonas aerilata]|uniref:Polyketide cyclase/dehydrase/lipid transport protein n=1 Tax=Homoserinimonas aerilata TaxID=1162970 RepID=A0A542YJF8_9MICO|nr:SRPBCC family protein [Homoserinimonas aerilata]TQL48209.1 polyketide cyclase/dehydrase/lipid transport protein [Homoserinimonas aerilata]